MDCITEDIVIINANGDDTSSPNLLINIYILAANIFKIAKDVNHVKNSLRQNAKM